MLHKLVLHHVGPAADLTFGPLASRFNLITGDNGLGKSFLLETAWWVLTRTWHETAAVASQSDASIGYDFDGLTTTQPKIALWDKTDWVREPGRPPNPGLVIHARVDGSFSVWDPCRNYRLYRKPDGTDDPAPPAYLFTADEVFWGLSHGSKVVCEGLIKDWVQWDDRKNESFDLLVRLLARIGPEGKALKPGKTQPLPGPDVREVPTIIMPYGEVPLTYAPAGVQRMCKLAYLLAWTFSQHERAAAELKQTPTRQVIILLDEPETHLHPKWQRTLLPSLLAAIEGWRADAPPAVQLIVATHSPMILASMEPIFDDTRDALWKLDLVNESQVKIERDKWAPRGDVNRWLTSDVFDLGAATNPETERALRAATDLINDPNRDPEAVRTAHEELVRLLPEMDAFFIRWHYYMKSYLEQP